MYLTRVYKKRYNLFLTPIIIRQWHLSRIEHRQPQSGWPFVDVFLPAFNEGLRSGLA